MPFPIAWLDRIFSKLTLTYGNAFMDRWRDLDPLAVKSDWLEELEGFEEHPDAIAFALQHLPERPPTVLEFRSICRRAPVAEKPQLEAPRADPERVRRELAKLGPIRCAAHEPSTVDHKAWAKRIVAKAESGATVAPCTLRFAREALGVTNVC